MTREEFTPITLLEMAGYFGVVIVALVVVAIAVIMLHDFAQGLADERAVERDRQRARDSFTEAFVPYADDVADELDKPRGRLVALMARRKDEAAA